MEQKTKSVLHPFPQYEYFNVISCPEFLVGYALSLLLIRYRELIEVPVLTGHGLVAPPHLRLFSMPVSLNDLPRLLWLREVGIVFCGPILKRQCFYSLLSRSNVTTL